MALPKFEELFNPILSALKSLGGSGRNEEIEEKVIDQLNLSEEDINTIHSGSRTEISYKLAWAKNYLKNYGLVENTQRGVWVLTKAGLDTQEVDEGDVKRQVRKNNRQNIEEVRAAEETAAETLWEDDLLNIVKSIEPDAFERLCQRLLRESGFVEVTVDGRSGDGGIDGRGIYRVGGLISIRVIFQSKRYKGSISSQQVREFKGTMTGRAEKGVFITTGNFTRSAKEEAARDGSAPIDLIDGEALVQLLKELGLGVEVKLREEIKIKEEWYRSI